MPEGLFHDHRSDYQKSKKQKAAYPFAVELIDRLLAQVDNKDAESIPGEAGLAGQLKKDVGRAHAGSEADSSPW